MVALVQAPAPMAHAAGCSLADVVDDTDASVTYSGKWDTFYAESDLCGSRVVGREAGSTMTIPFNASRAQVIGNTGRNLGIVQVELDGTVVAMVNTYSGSKRTNHVHYDTGTIADGQHTVTLTVTGEKDPRSVGIYATIDALVTGGQLQLDHDADLPDDAFFDAIDLDRPGLEAVRAAVSADDFAAARTALATYFTARTTPAGLFFNGDPPEPYAGFDRTAADQLVNGVSYSRGKQQAPPRTGYLPHLTELAHAYWWTSDERYATSLAGYLLSTAREAGAINRTNALNAAQQVPNWIAAWQALRTADAFIADQRIDVLKGLLARGRWLDRNTILERGARTTNITWMIAAANAYLGIMFPEFKEADRWRDRGLAGMELSLDQDIYPDGSEKELATTYHGVYPQRLLGIGELARRNGIHVNLLDRPEAKRMIEYLIPLVKPDGSIPQLNDSDAFLTQQALGGGQTYLEQTGVPELEAIAVEDPEHHAVSGTPRRLLAIGAEVFHDPEMAFVASGGSEGVKPNPTSRGLPYAGQAFQRTGWEPDDLSLVFDAGPYGRAHQHEDKLSIDVTAYGRTLVADPGRYTYSTSDPFRAYFMSTAAHSTVLVNGQGQRRSGLEDTYETDEPLADFGWRSAAVFDDASGTYDSGYGVARDTSVSHGREVFFAKQAGYWIITDRLQGSDQATTQTQFQFTPGVVEIAQDRPAVTYVTREESGRPTAGLVVDAAVGDEAAVTVAEGLEDPIRGWYSPRQGTKHAAPMAIFERSGALPRTDSTLLYPFAGAEAPAVRSTRLEVTGAGGAALPAGTASALRIQRPGAEDLFLSSTAPGTTAAFAEARSDGSRAWLSRTTNGGVQAFALVEGSTLTAPDGSVVVESANPLTQISGHVDGSTLHLEGTALPERLRVAAPVGVTEVQLNGTRVGFTRDGGTLDVWTTLSTEPLACTTTITGTHEGPLTVQAEQVVCVAAGTVIDGPVMVLDNGSFSAAAAHILGPVTARGARTVRLVETHVDGATRIEDTHQGVLLAAGTFGGMLSCDDNHPTVVDNGRPIEVTGRVTGQCQALEARSP